MSGGSAQMGQGQHRASRSRHRKSGTAWGQTYAPRVGVLPPCKGSVPSNAFDWIPYLRSLNFTGPILVGGDFNSPNALWGYSHTHPRGKLLEQEIEFSPLQLRNEPGVFTRIGLHSGQSDTTPDLTLATPGTVRTWRTFDSTWGSDHYPVLLHLNSKKFRIRRNVSHVNWTSFRQHFSVDSSCDFADFVASITSARTAAIETVTSTVEIDQPDAHMFRLLKKAERLTHRYRMHGKRHNHLMQLKHHYNIIKQYQVTLQCEHWHDLCQQLGRESGLSRLWRVFHSMNGRARKKLPIIDDMCLTQDYSQVEDNLIHTFFPHAVSDASILTDLPVIEVIHPLPELDSAFNMGELQTAISQGRPKSTPGYDNVKWQDLRNLPPQGLDVLLNLINDHWTSGTVPDPLRITIIHPIPKPGKDPNTPKNLRPIALTPVLCKLIERMINNRLMHHLECSGWFHPALTGFRPHLGTHDYLWLLRRVINRTARTALPDYVLALDLHKAFDNVSQSGILQELATAFPSRNAQNWVRNFLQHRPIRLNPSAHQPTTFYLDRGVPQGSILGPILFNLAMNRVARTLEQDTAARFAFYADDIVVWTEAKDYPSKDPMQTELQAAVFSLERSLSQFQLQLSPTKTELLSVDGKNSTNSDQVISIEIGDTQLDSHNGTIRLLGLPVSSCNSPRKWILNLKTTWRNTMHTVIRLSNKFGGARQQAITMLGRAIAHGRFAYGFPVYDLRPAHVKHLHILNRCLLRAISGLPQFTPVDILHQIVPLPSLDALIEETKLRLQEHLEQSPQGKAIGSWDHMDSKFDPTSFPLSIPPWERPAIGIPRRHPIPRRQTTARELYVHTIENDKMEDEVDIFTDAAMRGTEAAIAWTSPDAPLLNGSRQISNTYGLAEEAELMGILGAVHSIRDHSATVPTRKCRIITDSHVALRELNRVFSPNYTATSILHAIRELQLEGITIRIVWTPGHTPGAHGNHTAHTAARERLDTPPVVPSAPSPHPPRTDWQLRLRKFKAQSRRRLQDATPVGVLGPLKTLTRSGEVMANKIYANTALTPHVVHKWAHGATSHIQRCPYCNSTCTPNLCHLIWKCTHFTTGRELLLELGPPPADEDSHLQRVRTDPFSLETIIRFTLTSGLYKVV